MLLYNVSNFGVHCIIKMHFKANDNEFDTKTNAIKINRKNVIITFANHPIFVNYNYTIVLFLVTTTFLCTLMRSASCKIKLI